MVPPPGPVSRASPRPASQPTASLPAPGASGLGALPILKLCTLKALTVAGELPRLVTTRIITSALPG